MVPCCAPLPFDITTLLELPVTHVKGAHASGEGEGLTTLNALQYDDRGNAHWSGTIARPERAEGIGRGSQVGDGECEKSGRNQVVKIETE